MEKIRFIKNLEFDALPKISGVYFLYNKKELIYIGKAINIKNRVKNHFLQPSYRDNLFINKVNKIGFIETNSEISALLLEANLIKKYQPKFNVVWRDDKNYFYIAIAKNKQKIPYIFITHQKIENANHIGPFVEGVALKKTLKFLRRAFPFYTQKNHPKNKCIMCHLGLCPGPTPDLKIYKNNLKKLSQILQGKSQTVLKSLKTEMKNKAKTKNFEEAGKIRDQIFNLEKIIEHAAIIEKRIELPNKWDLIQKNLQKFLKLNKKIYRIECYDISNTQGQQSTGSMVVFENGFLAKNQYKKFKIKIDGKPNDIAMLKETISRRLKHSEWNYPEIMLIDGGIAQLNIAILTKNLNSKTKSIKVISIAKGKQELWIENEKKPIPLKNLPQEIYNLIKNLDDEAHRFAIAYHKKLRKKNLLKN